MSRRKKTGLMVLMVGIMIFLNQCDQNAGLVRSTENFGKNWLFHLGDIEDAQAPELNDADWNALSVPHDWSIEGTFSEDNPATPGGGALPGGIGWYRKSFMLPVTDKGKRVFIDFDGVYMNSDVWINGYHLGRRPYGYISFRYELTPHLKFGEKNLLAVRVDNSMQPNSRWYSGSGIYRNVWLVKTDPVYVDHWGTVITTPEVSKTQALVSVKTTVKNMAEKGGTITLKTMIYDEKDNIVAESYDQQKIEADSIYTFVQEMTIKHPQLWSVKTPTLYKSASRVGAGGKIVDDYFTTFGIRFFKFDATQGFLLNGESIKILGVCMHHDLGCLGSAINKRALERQLEILQRMGCNGIRTSHNPPAPELLDLCDRMGFIVMDEAFDMWKMPKTKYDYSLYYDDWHQRDLRDFIRRDRNHPSVFMWSIGNEIREQWDESGIEMAKELAGIVRELDSTRAITSGCNDPEPHNYIIRSGVLDLIGYNYKHEKFEQFPEKFPGQSFIASETGSAIATRGEYDMPSDVIRRWPVRGSYEGPKPNDDYTCSSYDNCCVPWGSTHEETWAVMKKHAYLSGMFYWTGFDYLGEPTPYWWPARSSYFGIIDLAGFPKDAYWFYQSEWTDKPVLHLFPHWNWQEGDNVDVWVYTNYDEVELFLNQESLGVKVKNDKNLHLSWRVGWVPGVVQAIAKNKKGQVLIREISTAGKPSTISLSADRSRIEADGKDLSFITVNILDDNGILVPHADNRIDFEVNGPGTIAGVDNGNPISHESFKVNYRKAFNGKCLLVVQALEEAGTITVTASSEGLQPKSLEIVSQ